MTDHMSALNMSLDDIIKQRGGSSSQGERRGRRRGGGGGRGGGRSATGPVFRQDRAISRETRRRNAGPYVPRRIAVDANTKQNEGNEDFWKHDLFQEGEEQEEEAKPASTQSSTTRPRNARAATGSKIKIANLNYTVTEKDLKDLFSPLGEIEKVSIKYDRSGRSEGVAFITFSHRDGAQAAIDKYNGKTLDTQEMHISFAAPSSGPRIVVSSGSRSDRRNVSVRRSSRRGGPRRGRPRGGARKDAMEM